MRKIKDESYDIEYGCLYVYYEDLVDIIDIISKNFDEYTLTLDDYEITNEDDIKDALDEIKNEGIENIYNLEINSSSGSILEDDYTNLYVKIGEYSSHIHARKANTLIRGIIGELNDILIIRAKKFRDILESPFFSFGFILILIPFLIYSFDFFDTSTNSFKWLSSILIFTGIISSIIVFFPEKFNKSKIFFI